MSKVKHMCRTSRLGVWVESRISSEGNTKQVGKLTTTEILTEHWSWPVQCPHRLRKLALNVLDDGNHPFATALRSVRDDRWPPRNLWNRYPKRQCHSRAINFVSSISLLPKLPSLLQSSAKPPHYVGPFWSHICCWRRSSDSVFYHIYAPLVDNQRLRI